MAFAARSPWFAVDALSDRAEHARSLRRVYDAFHEGREVDKYVRAVVAQSWERAGQAGIDPSEHRPEIVLDEDAIADRWERHPLYPVLPVLHQLLSDATTRAGHMLVISDGDGVLLWLEGHQRVIEATESMHFVCGADWSEAGAGTNALGTAIAVDHPVQIFSAEHFSRIVHPWQCSGAPIHDPETGEIIGVVDLTGHLKTAHPHTLALVTAAAGMAEAYLGSEHERRTQRLRERYCARIAGSAEATALINSHGRVLTAVPEGWIGGHVAVPTDGGDVTLPGGRELVAEPIGDGEGFLLRQRRSRQANAPSLGTLELELLTPRPRAILGGRTIELSPRQAELLTLLALWPDGFNAEQLALELYGEAGKPVTIRAELSRLRRLLGPALQAKPYRLAPSIRTDYHEVDALVLAGRLGAALELYRHPLLPFSEVPLLEEARASLDGSIRAAVIASADPTLLTGWCETASGRDDQPAAELLLGLLDPRDARRPSARAHAERLRRQDSDEPPPAW